MRILKTTEETKAYTENEAKEIMDKAREEARQKGYTIGTNGYTHKEKKSKGQVIDECWVVKIVKIFEPMWEESVNE